MFLPKVLFGCAKKVLDIIIVFSYTTNRVVLVVLLNSNETHMKLSTRSRYGTRLMFDLALNQSTNYVFLKDIARRQGLSEKYLSKLIIPLKNAGFVNSARGFKGGYALAKDPSKISIREIVEVLEGDLTPVECVHNSEVCCRISWCPTRDVWVGLSDAINKSLQAVSLRDVVTQYKMNAPEHGADYSI
jgi:Rrf2 family transcriptional regulator, iron-sulfur cluster assembly transcription factor